MKRETGDQIHIEQLEISARVGVSKKERAESQRLVLNVTVWPRFQAGNICDDITRTVNYSEIRQEIHRFVRRRSDKLIETLADAIAKHLLRHFHIFSIRLELRKFVLKNAKYVSVTVNRTAAVD